ncbi:MAG: SpoIIE family protein phosphatase [Ruminiclostridium sp.]|nr:SpoIIE family protein phosphatase [Ruminiclostridium sp.]
MIKRIKAYWYVAGAVVVAAIYLAISIFIFGQSSNTLITDTTQMYLGENVRAMSAIFETKLEDQLVMLESQVRYFEDIDLSDYNEMKATILATKGIGAFKTIGVANSTGATINYNGRSSGNIMLTDYFKEAMTGIDSVSQVTHFDEDGDEVLVLAVPIMNNGKAIGVVFGTFTKAILNDLVNTVSFAESGTNVLFDDDGTILAFSKDTSHIGPGDFNIYDMVGEHPVGSEQAIVNYNKNGEDMLAAFTAVGVHGWNFATLLPRETITDVTNTIGRYVIYVIIAVSLSFILLLWSILMLVKRLAKVGKERERIGAELGVATKIQADMLPTDYPEREDITLYASMTPAKEVGGDFYDFFFVDDGHLAMVMADVAGKGVPAALFMTIAKVILRNRVMLGGLPSEILFNVNNELCRNNRAGLFVTVWLGILDLNTGRIDYVNAGHEYPAISSPDKGFDVIKGENCPPLGAMEDMEFIDESLVLEPGGKLFLYTDGVPEAKNGEGARFGMDAMTQSLNNSLGNSAAELVFNVETDINNFVGNIEPFDDITMMCVNYLGRSGN